MATIGEPGAESLVQARAFQRALLDLLPLVQFLDREFAAAHGVSVTQCLALRLWPDGRCLTVNELAALLYLDKSTASRVAAALETKGYLARTRDPGDGRIVRLEVTPAGRGLRARADGDMARRYAELLSDFDPEVRAVMTRMLGRLTASLTPRVRVRRHTPGQPQMSKKSSFPVPPPGERAPLR